MGSELVRYRDLPEARQTGEDSASPMTALARSRPDDVLRVLASQQAGSNSLARLQQELAAMGSTNADLSRLAGEWVSHRPVGETGFQADLRAEVAEKGMFFTKRRQTFRASIRMKTW